MRIAGFVLVGRREFPTSGLAFTILFLSGRGKRFVPERREQMRETLVAAEIPFASINTIFVSTVEFCLWSSSHSGGAHAACIYHAWRSNGRSHRYVRD